MCIRDSLKAYTLLKPFLLQLRNAYNQSAAYWLHRIKAGFYWRHDAGDRRQMPVELLILAQVVRTTDDLEETGGVWDGRIEVCFHTWTR